MLRVVAPLTTAGACRRKLYDVGDGLVVRIREHPDGAGARAACAMDS
jgi:hypothetical protein